MTVRIRKSVWALPDTDETLMWYERAVEALWQRPLDDPRSWFYMGSVHGVPPGFPQLPAAQPFWDQCQHQSWYFLPWHRGYITAMEAVVAKEVADLGGPEDWALPYWNYAEDQAQNPNARRLPPAFRDAAKADGTRNFLFSRRRLIVNGDLGLTDPEVDESALTLPNFTNDIPGIPSGFGGPVTGFNPGGGDNGALEMVPHNVIHVAIGGFMQDPRTAAFDPIFWLHHCNIDRLWEEWRQNAAHVDPAAPMWRTGQVFDMHDGDGQPFTYTSEDMLDTTTVLHGFVYDTIPTPVPPTPADDDDTEGLAMTSSRDPELAGASETDIALGEGTTRATVPLSSDVVLVTGQEAPGQERRVYLELQGIKGTGAAANYQVLIDMPDDKQPPVLAGMLSTFGVDRASASDSPHGGSGVNQTYDITDHARALGLVEGNRDALEVAIQRIGGSQEAFGVPEGLEEMVAALPTEGSVSIGRINVIFR